MEKWLTIGEFAKVRGISTETLRHYDRCGLLKPAWTDRKTGYRYYSIFQDEDLAAILELRELGLSVKKIQAFFDDRNVERGYQLLKSQKEKLHKKIKELRELENSLTKKLSYFKRVISGIPLNKFMLRPFKNRDYISMDEPLHSDDEVYYSCIELEKMLGEKAPLLGTDRLAMMTELEAGSPVMPIIFMDETTSPRQKNVKHLGSGTYACLAVKGTDWWKARHREDFLNQVTAAGFAIEPPLLAVILLDLPVTGDYDEVIVEFQLKVSNAMNLKLQKTATTATSNENPN